jgi:hypothetical protein
VVARRVERDYSEAVLLGHGADVRAIGVKPKFRIESQGCILGNDQQQLIERRSPCG